MWVGFLAAIVLACGLRLARSCDPSSFRPECVSLSPRQDDAQCSIDTLRQLGVLNQAAVVSYASCRFCLLEAPCNHVGHVAVVYECVRVWDDAGIRLFRVFAGLLGLWRAVCNGIHSRCVVDAC